MFRSDRCSILGHDSEGWFVRDEKNETRRFALRIGFAEPTIAELTTERYQKFLLSSLEWPTK